MPVSTELQDVGHFVNSSLRLCVVSLLKRYASYAKEILHNAGAGESLDLAFHLAQCNGTQRIGAQVRFEMAILRSLDSIAAQTREIADAIILWLEEAGRGEMAGRAAAHKLPTDIARSTADASTVSVSEIDSLCHSLGIWSATPARKALILNPSADSGIPSGKHAEDMSREDLSHSRLTGLQQRVCELLVKNQQLRMALMAERADDQRDQFCLSAKAAQNREPAATE